MSAITSNPKAGIQNVIDSVVGDHPAGGQTTPLERVMNVANFLNMEVKEGKFEQGEGPSILDRVDTIGNVLNMEE